MTYTTRFCTPADESALCELFLLAFSTYSIPMQLSPEQFHAKFVTKLGIDWSLSPLVQQGGEDAAFIFTAVDDYQGKRTAYNGGTGVAPSHRGQRLVDRMYEALVPRLQAQGVTHAVLEVIADNTAAIKAYERVGFAQGDLLRCYKVQELPEEYTRPVPGLKLQTPEVAQWDVYQGWAPTEITFNDQWHRLAPQPGERVIEARREGECVGVIVFQPQFARLSALAVHPGHRGRGVGSALIAAATQATGGALTAINIRESMPGVQKFFTQLGFQNQVNQYEMWMPLG